MGDVLRFEVVLYVLPESGKLWDPVLSVRREISGSNFVCLTSSDLLHELDPSCSLVPDIFVSITGILEI
jgi:hypothetical protein